MAVEPRTDRNITTAPDYNLDPASLAEGRPEADAGVPKSLEHASPGVREKVLRVLHQAALNEYLSEAVAGKPTSFNKVRAFIAKAKAEPDEARRKEAGQSIVHLIVPNGVLVQGRSDVYQLIKELQDLGIQGIVHLGSNDVRLGAEEEVADPKQEGAFSLKSGDVILDATSGLRQVSGGGTAFAEVSQTGTPVRVLPHTGQSTFLWKGGGLKLHSPQQA